MQPCSLRGRVALQAAHLEVRGGQAVRRAVKAMRLEVLVDREEKAVHPEVRVDQEVHQAVEPEAKEHQAVKAARRVAHAGVQTSDTRAPTILATEFPWPRRLGLLWTMTAL